MRGRGRGGCQARSLSGARLQGALEHEEAGRSEPGMSGSPSWRTKVSLQGQEPDYLNHRGCLFGAQDQEVGC